MKVNVRRVSLAQKLDQLLDSAEGQDAMKRVWPSTVCRLSTSTLQRICHWHAHGRLKRMATEDLFVILEELARRRDISNTPFRSDEEALADLKARCMPHDLTTPHELTPSPTSTPLRPSWHGIECLGNGDWPGYECCCDECDHYLTCFPEFDQ